MLAIMKRDFRAYFTSPIAYVLTGLFVMILTLFFMDGLRDNYAVMDGVFSAMSFLVVIVTPLITMRSFAEDKKSGTEILLLTSPTNLPKIVLGKYFASLSVFMVMVGATLVFPLVLWIYGTPEGSKLFSAYVGFVLLGAVYVAIGVFMSSLTENQIVAAIITFVTLFGLTALTFIGSILGGLIGNIFIWISFMDRYYEFSSGIIDVTSIIFMLSYAVIFLFLTVRILERRRWGKG
jgi:ABC-2 type transport system permease protein